MKNRRNLRKRGLALLLSLIMCVSLLPAAALAEELTEAEIEENTLIPASSQPFSLSSQNGPSAGDEDDEVDQGDPGTLRVTFENADVAYSYRTWDSYTNANKIEDGTPWTDLIEIKGDSPAEISLPNFLRPVEPRDGMSFLVCFVKPHENCLFVTINGDRQYYSIDEVLGEDSQLVKNNYPGLETPVNRAKENGYIAAFGWKVVAQRETMVTNIKCIPTTLEVVVTCDKETEVKPNDPLTFTVTLTPTDLSGYQNASVTGIDVTSLTINGQKQANLDEPKKQTDGTFELTVPYTATEEDCISGSVKLEVEATVSYEGVLTLTRGQTTTESTSQNTATATCSIAPKGEVKYVYAPAEGITEELPSEGLPQLPQTETKFSKDSINVASTPKEPVITDNGQWTFEGWYLNGKKVTENEQIIMGDTALRFIGYWSFTPKHTVTYILDGKPYEPYEIESYLPGTTVTLLSVPDAPEGCIISDWSSSDATLTNGIFLMPDKNVVITATTTKLFTVISKDYEAIYDAKGHGIAVDVTSKVPGEEVNPTTTYYEDFALTKETKNVFTHVTRNENNDVDFVTVYYKVETAGYRTETGSATVRIKPAPVTVTTDSNSKTYDGNPLTAPGKIEGIMENETVTFEVTGSQTNTGSSTNTYTLAWDGNAQEGDYEVTENLGTLTVNSRNPQPPQNPPVYIPDSPTPSAPRPVSSDPTGTTIEDEDVPLAAPGLNSVDHFDYIKGYPDGTVRPGADITRAEVATIFFRLMTKEYRSEHWSTENDFPDVSSSAWYNNAVSTCAKAGILAGNPDGTFRPEDSITREEFASIAARFASDEVPAGGMFSDIAGRWSEHDIERAAAMGWIKGNNGKFRPTEKITRAEVMTAINRMLDRVPDADHMLDGMTTFPDNTPDMWYYAEVQEAANSHDYKRDESGVFEAWTGLLPDQKWADLEKEWATANSADVADVMG